MNSSGDEDEDQFFESSDRIPSATTSDTEEEAACDSVHKSGVPVFNSDKYEIWKSEPGSVRERRERLLREFGLSNDGERRRDLTGNLNNNNNNNFRRVHFSEIQPVAECPTSSGDADRSIEVAERGADGPASSSAPRCPSDRVNPELRHDSDHADSANGKIGFGHTKHNSSPLIRTDVTNEPNNLHSLQSFSSGDLRDEEGGEVRGGVISATDSSGELVKIKNLDNGKEFVVNEVRDGMWNKLKELDTGRQLTADEFKKVVGHSPLVEELMRRESVEQATQKQSPDLRNSGKAKKKGGWFKTIKDVANTMRAANKEKKSSDERDTSSEKGGQRSSSATDESQETCMHVRKKTKVWQYGKSCKEFSALFMGQEIKAHQGSIWALRFSLDGRYLASGGQDRIVHVWQVTESKQKHDESAEKTEESISNTYVNANGSTEYVSLNIENSTDKRKRGMFMGSRKSSATSADCIIMPDSIFSLSDKPMCTFEGHLDDILDISWSQSQYLLSSSMDKTVRLWHMSYKICLRVFSHNDYVTCIQFNPIDDRYFISGSLDKKFRIWSIPARKVVDWIDIYEMVTAACYTPDGQRALVGTHKGKCLCYNASGNRLQEETEIDVVKKKKKSHGKKITGFQFVPGNSRKVLITSADSRLRVFDGAELVQKFKGFRNTNSQISASFTTNGKYIISASEDSYVYIWNYDFPSNPAAKDQGICQNYEYFLSRKVSAAIPWPGIKSGSFSLSPGELMHAQRHNPELLVQEIGNAGRKSGSFPQASAGQGCEFTLDTPLMSISGNSEIQAKLLEINDSILEGVRVRDRNEESVQETMKQNVLPAFNHRVSDFDIVRVDASSISDSISGSLQANNLTASSTCERVLDHSSPNHGLFTDILSKGATWPEEKLPAFTIQSPNLVTSELPNKICESSDGTSIQDQSTLAAWGSVIVTAGLGGEIKTFQNYGWPVRL